MEEEEEDKYNVQEEGLTEPHSENDTDRIYKFLLIPSEVAPW